MKLPETGVLDPPLLTDVIIDKKPTLPSSHTNKAPTEEMEDTQFIL